MNKTLIRAAAVITLVAASITFFACSGEDGSDGKPGEGCTLGTAANGGTDITCGTTVTNIPPSVGGGCTVNRTSAGTFVASCNGTEYPIAGGTGGGSNCEISDGDAYYIITCGGTPMQIAKAWCDATPYNPSKQVCVGGQLSVNKCGLDTIDLDKHFCYSSKKYPLCGKWTVANPMDYGDSRDSSLSIGIEYDPATQFCAPYDDRIYPRPNGVPTAPDDTVYTRCGTVPVADLVQPTPTPGGGGMFGGVHSSPRGIGFYDPADKFCYESATGTRDVRDYCGGTAPSANVTGLGKPYTKDELCVFDPSKNPCITGGTSACTAANGDIKGSCASIAYEPSKEFCYNSTQIYAKCDTSGAGDPLATGKEYAGFDPATQFCGPNSKSKNDILSLCGAKTSTKDNRYNPILQFCLNGAIVPRCAIKLELFTATSAPAWPALGTPLASTDLETLREADSTALLTVGNDPSSAFALTIGGPATPAASGDKKYELSTNSNHKTPAGVSFLATEFCGEYGYPTAEEQVLTRCGNVANTTYGPGGYDGKAGYCSGTTVTPLLRCGQLAAGNQGTNYDLYNPTLELCDDRFVTLKGTVLATAPGQLYKVKTIGTTTWMTENLYYTGVTGEPVGIIKGEQSAPTPIKIPAGVGASHGEVLYTWNEANIACPEGYRLPTDAEWQAIEGTDTAPLKAASGWPTGTNGQDELGFTAKPYGRAVFDEEKSGNNCGTVPENCKYDWKSGSTRAYWWSGTSVNGSIAKYKVLSYDYHTFQEPVTTDGVTTYIDGQGNKATFLASVRCVKN